MSPQRVTCEEAIHQLSAYLDQELDSATSAAIDRHLETCRECFSRAEFEARLRARVRDAGQEKAPDRLRRRIKGVLECF